MEEFHDFYRQLAQDSDHHYRWLVENYSQRQGEEPSSVTEQFLKPVTLEDIEEVFNKLSQDVNEAPQAAQTTQAAQAATEATQATQAATEATQATQAATEATQAATEATQAATEATQAPQTAQAEAEVPKGKQGFT